MNKPVYNLVRQVLPETRLKYFILETVITADGPRTRIVNGRWATDAEAQAYMEMLELKARA